MTRPISGFTRRPRKPREIDAVKRGHAMRVLPAAILVGVAGAGIGGALTPAAVPVWAGAIGGFVVGACGFYFSVLGLAQAAGRGFASFLLPSGRSTPRKIEYSRAESLLVRGLVEEAVTEYLAHVEASPHDAEPRLRLARLYRDRLTDDEEAVRWFRRAVDAAGDPARAQPMLRELVDLLSHRMGAPARALPELARFAERNPGTKPGAWAASELAALRSQVWSEDQTAAPEAD